MRHPGEGRDPASNCARQRDILELTRASARLCQFVIPAKAGIQPMLRASARHFRTGPRFSAALPMRHPGEGRDPANAARVSATLSN
jgi:hypothetical protein